MFFLINLLGVKQAQFIPGSWRKTLKGQRGISTLCYSGVTSDSAVSPDSTLPML